MGACSLALLIAICAAMPAAARAAEERSEAGVLSPRLAELATPAIRSASPTEQAKALSLAAEGPGSLVREGNRVLVEVRFGRGAAAGVDDLRAAGAEVLGVDPRYQRVTVAARPAELRRLSRVPRVAGASEVVAPVTSAVTPCFGDATSEGDTQLRAAEAREEFGIDGSGVTVGILSDSFNRDLAAPTNAAGDVASGDLPGPENPCGHHNAVNVVDDTEAKGEDEGRAMAQIVHDLAPGANLAFATAFKKTMFGFADNIRKLAEPTASGGAEANVIADDVSYFEEPFFQEGPVGVAVREVSEAGVSYFSSAGNNNLIDEGRDFSSWEAPEFRDSFPTPCPVGLPGYAEHCMDFDPGEGVDPTFAIRVAGRETLNVDLQWAQPWEGVTTDFDDYLLNAANERVAESEDFNVTQTQMPYEFLSWTNPSGSAQTVRLAIDRCDTTCGAENGGDTGTPRIKLALMENGGGVLSTEYETSGEGDVVGPTIFGHNGAADAMSVGAIRFDTSEEPEFYSSRGPVTHYFGPVEGTSAATELSSPEVLAKPDLVATDGGANTFFGSCLDTWRFFGTSAAAPHAAAIAALQRQAKPTATAAEVDQAQRDSAVAVGAFSPGPAIGAGMLDAVGAIEALGVSPTSPSAPETPPAAGPCASKEPEEPQPQEPGPNPPTGEPGPGSGGGQGGNGGGGEVAAPNTFFGHHPKTTLLTSGRTATAAFLLRSDQSGVTFLCKVDSGGFHRCAARFVRRYTLGRHVLRAKARNAAGKTDSTPAVFRFQVKPLKRKTG